MKIFSVLILTAGLSFTAGHINAQATAQNKTGSDANAMAQQITAVVKQMVAGVTPDQESNILAAEQDYSKGVLDVRNSTAGNNNMSSSEKMDKYNQLEALRQTRDAKIKTTLSADQFAQYQKVFPAPPPIPAGR